MKPVSARQMATKDKGAVKEIEKQHEESKAVRDQAVKEKAAKDKAAKDKAAKEKAAMEKAAKEKAATSDVDADEGVKVSGIRSQSRSSGGKAKSAVIITSEDDKSESEIDTNKGGL